MTGFHNIHWPRAFADGFAIIVSILLAFGIQAWWEERQERRIEHEELTRLLDEFSSNRDLIQRNMLETSFRRRIEASSLNVSNVLDTAIQEGREFAPVSNRDLSNILQYPTLELETPVFDSLVRSGRIEIIEDTDIIISIRNWDGRYRNANESERDSRQFAVNHFFPAIAEVNDIQHILVGRRTRGAIDFGATTMIRANRKLANTIAERYYWIELSSDQWSDLQERTDHVIETISRFLNQ
ncbi:MAG: hypothetical protein AB8B95_14795 [Pseudohongiellaceae bacterium]